MTEQPHDIAYIVGEFIRKGAVAQRVANQIIERHHQLQNKRRRKAKEGK
jgi:hypothetical protein